MSCLTSRACVEVFCGVKKIGMSQIVNTTQRVEAKRKIQRWAETGQAIQAVLCAAKMLRRSIQVRLVCCIALSAHTIGDRHLACDRYTLLDDSLCLCEFISRREFPDERY